MTNVSDVIRQIETVTCDQQYPPTENQKKRFTRILHTICPGISEFKRCD